MLASFFLMKISFQITARAMWLDTVQHQPVNYSQSASRSRGDRVHCEQSAQSRKVTGDESWWINDCRWSSVRVLAPEMTHRLWMGISRRHSSCLPLRVPGNVCVCVHFFRQVEMERRDREASLCFWSSCCPTDRAWAGSTGLAGIPFLLLERKIGRPEAPWRPQRLSRD